MEGVFANARAPMGGNAVYKDECVLTFTTAVRHGRLLVSFSSSPSGPRTG